MGQNRGFDVAWVLPVNDGYRPLIFFEIILAISVKTLNNYSNHIFHTDLDATFVGYELQRFFAPES